MAKLPPWGQLQNHGASALPSSGTWNCPLADWLRRPAGSSLLLLGFWRVYTCTAVFVVCGCAYCPVATQIGIRIDPHYAPSMWQCETSCERKKKQRILPEYPRFERRTDTANSAPGSSASNFRAPAGHRMYATVVQRYSASRTVGPTFPSQRKIIDAHQNIKEQQPQLKLTRKELACWMLDIVAMLVG